MIPPSPDEPAASGGLADFVEQAHYIGLHPARCPYLKTEISQLRFILARGVDAETYHQLMDRGYRRHGSMAYRPQCPNCNACEVLRVPIETFKRSKSQRRAWNRCHGRFESRFTDPFYSDEKADMYNRYLAWQHDSNDRDISQMEYTDFFVNSFIEGCTKEHQLWYEGKLAAWGIVDILPRALSTVYFCFDPDFQRESLGVYSALLEIEHARSLGIPYYYMGYYIAPCPSMAYKADYRPHQRYVLDSEAWTDYE